MTLSSERLLKRGLFPFLTWLCILSCGIMAITLGFAIYFTVLVQSQGLDVANQWFCNLQPWMEPTAFISFMYAVGYVIIRVMNNI